MAATFPTSPSNGDTATVGGRTYTYNSTNNVWERTGSSPDTVSMPNLTITDTLTTDTVDISNDLAVDTNTLFVDSSNSQVGIGTNSPDELLHLLGNGFETLKVESTGSSADPVLALTNNSSGSSEWTLRLDKSSSNVLQFRYNNGAHITVDVLGNTGIGTSSPSEKLDVNGNVSASSFIGDGSQLTGIGSGLQTIFKTICISENVNFGSFTKGSIFNTSPDVNQGGFSVTSTDITVPEDGIYLCSFNFRISSSSARTNTFASWGINDTNQGEYAASAYIRNASGHDNSSLHCTTIFELSADDELQVYFQREANNATTTLIGSSSTVSIIKIG